MAQHILKADTVTFDLHQKENCRSGSISKSKIYSANKKIILRSASLTVFHGSTSKDFSSWCLWRQRTHLETTSISKTSYKQHTRKSKMKESRKVPSNFWYSGETRSIQKNLQKYKCNDFWLFNRGFHSNNKYKLTICVSFSVRTPRARVRVVCTFLETANTCHNKKNQKIPMTMLISVRQTSFTLQAWEIDSWDLSAKELIGQCRLSRIWGTNYGDFQNFWVVWLIWMPQ